MRRQVTLRDRTAARSCDCGGTSTPIWQSWDDSIAFLICPNCEQLTVVSVGRQPRWLVNELKHDILQRYQQGEFQEFLQTAKNPDTQEECEV